MSPFTLFMFQVALPAVAILSMIVLAALGVYELRHRRRAAGPVPDAPGPTRRDHARSG